MLVLHDPVEKIESYILTDMKETSSFMGMAAWQHARNDDARMLTSRDVGKVDGKVRTRAKRKRLARSATIFRIKYTNTQPKAGPTQTGKPGVELTFRSPVTGHWRNQACGPGRKERKRIWIANHVRRPDLPARADLIVPPSPAHPQPQ